MTANDVAGGKKATFGMIGLGVMGSNLALNLHDHGETVAVWNVTGEEIDRFVADNAGGRFLPNGDLRAFCASIARPRRILMMIRAGEPVDSVLAQLHGLLESGDVVIDGGNSWFRDTQRRQQEIAPTGARLLGCGVSGGEEGARHGPSLMAGGDAAAYETVRPALEAIAAITEMGPCVSLLGPDGAGHFVKMIHNGIEYADMQGIAEVYDLLRRGIGRDAAETAEVFRRWNEGPLESFLIELTSKVLTVRDPESDGPLVDRIEDRAGQKGTGRWAVQLASELGVPVPTIAAAVDARILSDLKEQRLAAASLYPQAVWDLRLEDEEGTLRRIAAALYAAKICAYAQGMNVIREASHTYGWNVPLRETGRIWKGGCIIRARFLDLMLRAYAQSPDLPNLLLDPEIRDRMESAQEDLRETVRSAQSLGIPVPSLSASLAYFDSYRSPRLPQNLTQAQRDAFGAHTYRREDRPGEGPFHTDWLGAEHDR